MIKTKCQSLEQPRRKAKTLLQRRNYHDENEKTGKRRIENNPFLILYMDGSYDISFDFVHKRRKMYCFPQLTMGG